MEVGAIPLENVVKIIRVAEEITGSPLFQLIKDRLPQMGVELSEAQKMSLDANYASYAEAITDSKASEETGRSKEPLMVHDSEEGDSE